jgi:1-acyl-sn-glycerol-3-phosphate acyltransferase
MILKAKHHFIIYPFFKWYAQWIVKRQFGKVRIIGHLTNNDRPILLIANHTSWWDGFWAMYVNLKIFRRKFYFMMLEQQLRKYWLFNYAGGFSVHKQSKSIIETLTYTTELLKDSNNLVLVFPQGEIQSMHTQNIEFEKGIERILKNSAIALQVVFMVNLIDYFSNRKPGVYFHLQEYKGDAYDAESIQRSYNQFFAESVKYQMNFKNQP